MILVRLSNDRVCRVSNEKAAKIVKLGNGNYRPKSVYKAMKEKRR